MAGPKPWAEPAGSRGKAQRVAGSFWPPAGRKSTFILPAPKGQRCESAFALLSHKKVTKRLWPAASYGKIGAVGYGLFAGKGRVIL